MFTVDSEMAFLAAFTNCVMAEVSRLDAIAADQMKVDFISSISRKYLSQEAHKATDTGFY